MGISCLLHVKKGVIPPPLRVICHSSVFRGGVPVFVVFLLLSLAFIPLITSTNLSDEDVSSLDFFSGKEYNTAINETTNNSAANTNVGNATAFNDSNITATQNDTSQEIVTMFNTTVSDENDNSDTINDLPIFDNSSILSDQDIVETDDNFTRTW